MSHDSSDRSGAPGAPRLARRLLLRAFPEREGRAAAADLDEEHAERVTAGRRRADLWYWGQTVRSIGHGLVLARRARLRDGRNTTGKGGGMDGMWTDVRYAMRSLVNRPLFSGLAVVTLAVGIGATAAAFTVVRAALLAPLPFEEPDELVQFWGDYTWTNPEFLSLRDAFPGFERVFAYTSLQLTLPDTEGGPARVVGAVEASGEMFETLGVGPAVGRTLRPGDDVPGAPPVVVLGHDLWRSAFGADPAVVGRVIDVSGVRRTVVGVLPADFWFPDREVGLYVPRPMDPEVGTGSLVLVGRLLDGRAVDAMDAELGAITRVLGETFDYPDPRWDRTLGADLTPLGTALLGRTRQALYLTLGATVLILVIACANVSALLLGRLRARRGELAVRSAMGAGRVRLLRQLVVESLVLGLLGGVLGAVVAAACFRLLLGTLPLMPGLARGLTLDWSLFAVALGFAAASGLLVGLGPLVALAGTDLRGAMTGRSGDGQRGLVARLESGLIVAEVALAVTLVTGAGLLVASVRTMNALDPGFEPEGVVAIDVVQGSGDFGMAERARNLVELGRRAEALPGVLEAGSIQQPPLRGSGWNFGLTIEDQPEVEESTLYRMVTPGYFETMGIEVLRGRTFLDSDAPEDPPVVVINDAMAERYWPGEDALGRRVDTGVDDRWATVVGIVEDVRIGGFREPVRPARYMLAEQISFTADQHTLVVRTDGTGAAGAAELRALVAGLDPRIAIARIDDMEDRVTEAMGEARELMILLSLLGGLALLLGAVGTYGVVSHWVNRRSRTWGILLALGMPPGRVVGRVMRHGGGLALAGGLLGIGGGLLGARALRSFLYEVSPTQPEAFAVAVLTLLGSALLAAWLPARRAARTDPLTVLNEQ